jgi:hypothetical protein
MFKGARKLTEIWKNTKTSADMKTINMIDNKLFHKIE